jgi:hypothetical protein
MEDDREERLWTSRLRWRLRGAWQAPTFVATTLLGALLLNRLPISGDEGLDPIGGFLLCGFFNLVVAGFLAPVGARLLQRRRPSPVPVGVVQDRVATSLMAALAVTLLAIGLGHRSAVADAQREFPDNPGRRGG